MTSPVSWMVLAVLSSAAPLADGAPAEGEHAWTWWAAEWLGADSQLVEHGNDAQIVASASVRRTAAEKALRTTHIEARTIANALLGDPASRRLALAAVIARGSTGDNIVEAVLGPVWSDDDATRRYLFVALRVR